MALTGDQWLDQVFRPALATLNRHKLDRIPADSARLLGARLAAQLDALGDTGVLTDEQERAAYAALAQANIAPETRSTSVSAYGSASGFAASARPIAARVGSAPIVPHSQEEPAALVAVFAGPRHLGDLDGRPVTLIVAELWNDCFFIDLCTDPGPDHRDRQTSSTRAYLEWMRDQRRGRTTERPAPPPRTPSPLQSLGWELRDEAGTGYVRTGGSGESRDYVDRQRMRWSPAPPGNANRLTLLATDATGTVVFTADIPVPR